MQHRKNYMQEKAKYGLLLAFQYSRFSVEIHHPEE